MDSHSKITWFSLHATPSHGILRRMKRLRETLRPMLTERQKDYYTPTLQEIGDRIEEYHGRVSRLTIYPVKAVGGFDVSSADLSATGLSTHSGFRDRALMIVRKTEGGFERFSQRQEPLLAQIRTRLILADTLRLENHRCSSVDLTPDQFCYRSGETTNARMYEDTHVIGVLEDPGTPLTQFIRDHLASLDTYTPEELQRIRILHGTSKTARNVPQTHSGSMESYTDFADVGQHLLINQSTGDYLNRHIQPGVAVDAYRPNFTVEGWPPNLEDIVSVANIGNDARNIQMRFGVMSTRCAVTMVDQDTGVKRHDKEPLASLVHMRPQRNGSPTMGINIAHRQSDNHQRVSVGDAIVPIGEKMVEKTACGSTSSP